MLPLGPPLRRRFPQGLPQPPEPEPEPPARPVISEAEAMAAIFLDARFDVNAVEIRQQAPTRAKTQPHEKEKKEKEKKKKKEKVEDGSPVEDRPISRSARDELQGLRDRDWAGASWSSLAEPREPAERAELSVEEQRLIAAARRRSPLPTLRIRGLRRRDALIALEDFVSLQSAAGRRYIRVITGKGIASRAEPVLKSVLIVWCAGEGAQFVRQVAPERDSSLEFGAFILALRRLVGSSAREL